MPAKQKRRLAGSTVARTNGSHTKAIDLVTARVEQALDRFQLVQSECSRSFGKFENRGFKNFNSQKRSRTD